MYRSLLALAILTLCLAAFCPAPAPGNACVPGELIVDPVTVQSLAFRWFVEGDTNGNATVTVGYRKQGESRWRVAEPLLRINREVVDRAPEPYRCGNLFAGSILFLAPGTTYEVRFTLRDPDGGAAERTVTVRTLSVPPPARGERRAHVYPAGYAGRREEPSVPELTSALRAARPGDVLLLHAGTYRGQFRVQRSGTPDEPIVLCAAGDGQAVLEGPDGKGNVLEADQGTQDLQIEGLTFRNGYTGIKANGARRLVVRRCRIEDVNCGVITYTTDARDWYVADNTITGRVRNWYPRVESSDTGVNCSGSGHTICRNRISHFWDDVSTDNCGEVRQEWGTAAHPPQMAIDICDNDISEALDDGIEADDTLHNVRVFRNRITNTHTGLSAQPHFGGPLYFLRNALYNITYAPFKLHNRPTGLRIYHNTALGARQGLESWPPAWRNATFRNNLFLGVTRYAVETGSPDPHTTLDYDGFRKTPDPERFINWSTDGGKSWSRYPTLAAFFAATGQERHGILVDYADLVRAAPPVEGHTYRPEEIDLRLRPSSKAVDAGVAIPNVNDGFRGRAPDLGCCGMGDPPPRYGPRP
jgi:hypothetical protein